MDRKVDVPGDAADAHYDSEGLSFSSVMLLLAPLMVALGFAIWYFVSLIQPPPQRVIVMSTGSPTGGYHAMASRYQAVLAREGVRLELVNSAGSVENLQRLKDPSVAVDVALIQGGIGAGQTTDGLISVGRMFYEPLWIFHGASRRIERLSQLKGGRLVVGAEGSGTRALATDILRRANVTADNTTLLASSIDDAVAGVTSGTIDAVFLAFAPEAPALQKLLRNPDLRLMSLGEAEALSRMMPYLSRVTLPAGIFDLEAQIPKETIELVAPVASLVVRQSLHPALVGLFARAASEVHGGASLLQKAGEFPVATDPVFPISQDAERYYKSGQPLLQRYLPFWLANFVERALVVLVPLATIAIPLARGLPALYKWRVQRRLNYWYWRLKRLEHRIARAPSPEVARRNLAELDTINRAVAGLNVPRTFAQPYYDLRGHIDFVRSKLTG